MGRLPENDNCDEDSFSPSDLSHLEAIIFSARNFVVPSDDLRPRTIDEARGMSMAKANTVKIGYAATAGLMAWGCMVLIVSLSSDLRDHWVAPFGLEMQQIAAELSIRNREDFDWAMVEAFRYHRGIPLGRSSTIP